METATMTLSAMTKIIIIVIIIITELKNEFA